MLFQPSYTNTVTLNLAHIDQKTKVRNKEKACISFVEIQYPK